MSQLNCPHCAQPYQLTPEQWPQYEGRTITCTRCNQPFMVSGSIAAPVATAVAPSAGAGYAAPSGYAPPGAYGPPGGFAPPGYGVPPGGGFYPPTPAKKGFPWLIVCIGVGALLVIPGVLLALLLPALSRARGQAQRVQCTSNMRQLGMSVMMYANNNKGYLPRKISDLARDQLVFDGKQFVCSTSGDTPATGTGRTLAANIDTGGHLSYVYVGAGMRLYTVRNPSTTVILYEPLSDHNGDGANFLFADGHAEWIEKARAQGLIRNLENGKNPPTGSGP